MALSLVQHGDEGPGLVIGRKGRRDPGTRSSRSAFDSHSVMVCDRSASQCGSVRIEGDRCREGGASVASARPVEASGSNVSLFGSSAMSTAAEAPTAWAAPANATSVTPATSRLSDNAR